MATAGGEDWDALSDKIRREFEDKLEKWAYKLETKVDGAEVYRSAVVQSGVTCWKCEATFELPADDDDAATAAMKTVFDAYYTWEHRKRWDTTFHEDSCELDTLGHERRTLDYSRTLPALGGVISARDFVDLREWAYAAAPDGEGEKRDVIVAWGASVTHPSKSPVSGIVRGHNHPCGTWLARDGWTAEGGQVRVKLILLWHSDIKGWVPTRAVDQAMGQQMLTTISGLRAYLSQPDAK